jgi:hypothetical protein
VWVPTVVPKEKCARNHFATKKKDVVKRKKGDVIGLPIAMESGCQR